MNCVADETVDVLLTTGEAAKHAGVSTQLIMRWIDDGLLAGVRLPGSTHRRVRLSVLKAFETTWGLGGAA